MKRKIHTIKKAIPATDGAGVRIRRIDAFDGALDPFLMLDEFGSANPDDYIAGFPNHPHRGFETVTYMLEGSMEHGDHLGNKGLLDSGDVQWMTAGRGVIHSELPRQTDGRMRGFQLWLNLPAAEKMVAPDYRDLKSDQLTRLVKDDVELRIIAGRFELASGESAEGPVMGKSTDPRIADIRFGKTGANCDLQLPSEHRVALYVYEGAITVNDGADLQTISAGQLAIMDEGDEVSMTADADNTNVYFLAGKPIGEPIAHYGPFVMNTRAELDQAIQDYRSGALTEAPRP